MTRMQISAVIRLTQIDNNPSLTSMVKSVESSQGDFFQAEVYTFKQSHGEGQINKNKIIEKQRRKLK